MTPFRPLHISFKNNFLVNKSAASHSVISVKKVLFELWMNDNIVVTCIIMSKIVQEMINNNLTFVCKVLFVVMYHKHVNMLNN